MSTLPRVAAPVLAAAVDALPTRLRKKLDDAVTTAAGWPVTTEGGAVAVGVDATTTVTLSAVDGTVTSPDQVLCTCLLAPNCLHRAAVLARCPTDDTPAAPAADHAEPPGEDDRPHADRPLTLAQRAAAEHLYQAGAAILAAGVSGSGVVAHTALLRATHEARVHGLHRAAATGRDVAGHLYAARERQPQYRLGDLTDDLRELLAVTRRLREADLAPAAIGPLVGRARRRYDLHGSLRLYGLCSTPVVTDSGYAGVITYLVDRDARMWTVADVVPGGEEHAAVAGDAGVALGEAALTHRALGRAGLVVSGATATDNGALGAGQAVRAVRADGVAWADEPAARLWETPLDEQVRRAFGALALPVQDRPAGDDLLFLAGQVLGTGDDGVRMATGDGTVLTLTVPSDHARLPYRDNLRVLAGASGLDIRVIGRPDPVRRQAVHALSIATTQLALPDSWAGRVDLGFDRLSREHVPSGRSAAEPTAEPTAEPEPAVDDLALYLIRRHAERVVAGGRAVHALASSDEPRVRAARLDTGAGLLRALATAAQVRPRDPFGRPVEADATAFAEAWLAVAVYEQAASRALNEACWLPGRWS